MKRITFFILLFFIAGHINAFCQDADIKEFTSKLDKSNKALENPKKNTDPKTWIERGNLLQSIASANTQLIRGDMTQKEVKLFMNEPKKVISGPEAGKEQYVYDRITLTFINGKLKSWKETQQIIANPIGEAFNSYNKASELDVNGKNKSAIADGLKNLKTLSLKEAFNYYSLNDYTGAFNSFKQILDINEMKQINLPNDTAFIYNTGYTATAAGLNDEAIKYLSKAAELKYKDPGVYKNLKLAYFAKKDTANGLNALEKGVALYPGNLEIMVELINYYLLKGNKDKAVSYLSQAKAADPKNKSFYFAEGGLYSNMCDKIDTQLADLDKAKRKELDNIDEAKKVEFKSTGNNMKKYQPIKDKYQKLSDAVGSKYKTKGDSLRAIYSDMQLKAVEQYKKAAEIDPSYFEAYYYLGNLYVNSGNKIHNQAAEVENDKYEAFKAKGDEEFKKALTYFEKAHEINPKDRDTMTYLKKLYYRLNMTDKYNEINKQLEESK
jgi:Flp pilus assembly protein TadD, contains TPR repeats